jgi:hypothetical protein
MAGAGPSDSANGTCSAAGGLASTADGGDDPNLQGRNLAVSYAIAGDSGPMTFHSDANQTSFITAAGSGDHTAE